MKTRNQIKAVAAVSLSVFACVAAAQQAAPQSPTTGDPKEAHKKIAMCEGCHGIPGYKTAYPAVYHVPKLGGQTATYLANALNAYKRGQRSHPSMRAIAASLSDKDIADLSAYYATATGEAHK
jgi:cytochrome c553